jgi:hypothetical protein
MSLSGGDPVLVALRLVLAVVSLLLLVFGVSVAVSRRFPSTRLRHARPRHSQRSQPVRIGGCVALVGASLECLRPLPWAQPRVNSARRSKRANSVRRLHLRRLGVASVVGRRACRL